MDYTAFFELASGHTPYPYQDRLAQDEWPEVLDIPTGLGKTAAVVLSWLFRHYQQDSSAPRRLVYCLPMRTLVEQTVDQASSWCRKLHDAFKDRALQTPTVHLLMGGESNDHTWVLNLEQPAILIGTQDMLISAALMRAYGMSRFTWPMIFGALHNDAMWIFDETQLMGVAVETSAQLEGFRTALGTFAPSKSLWMSATLGNKQLSTVDHPEPHSGWNRATLGAEDHSNPRILQRLNAPKLIQVAGIRLDKDNEKATYARQLAEQIEHAHQPGSLTLVIVNSVSRARQIYEALLKNHQRTSANTALIHSRFRLPERRAAQEILLQEGDRIVVATQAIEAGVDVSARTMFTELAPWSSLVQRFGRCNRGGEFTEAKIYLIDFDLDSLPERVILPYAESDLKTSKELLQTVSDVGPQSLSQVSYQPPEIFRPVIRRKDLLDLFDTTPDLSGDDLDVSRYVRDGNDTDVLFFWRAWEGEDPNSSEMLSSAHRDELCRVSLGAARVFLTKLKNQNHKAWSWDALEGIWTSVENPRPGQILLLSTQTGGYEPQLGWTGDVSKKSREVPPLRLQDSTKVPVTNDSDPLSLARYPIELKVHLHNVTQMATHIAKSLGLNVQDTENLQTAAAWHDVGKAHFVFQEALNTARESDNSASASTELWAKSDGFMKRYSRTGFRHELASALAFLQHNESENTSLSPEELNLIAYIIAAHHGRVRLSIRSMPGEKQPTQDTLGLFARGIWHGDTLPEMTLPDGQTINAIRLSLELMQLGPNSWLERTLTLRNDPHLGPFRLSFWELLLRAADQRASAQESESARQSAPHSATAQGVQYV